MELMKAGRVFACFDHFSVRVVGARMARRKRDGTN
jgi:hypothetical protein